MDSTRKGKVDMRYGKVAVEAEITAIIGNRMWTARMALELPETASVFAGYVCAKRLLIAWPRSQI